jgi:hypothetical protein
MTAPLPSTEPDVAGWAPPIFVPNCPENPWGQQSCRVGKPAYGLHNREHLSGPGGHSLADLQPLHKAGVANSTWATDRHIFHSTSHAGPRWQVQRSRPGPRLQSGSWPTSLRASYLVARSHDNKTSLGHNGCGNRIFKLTKGHIPDAKRKRNLLKGRKQFSHPRRRNDVPTPSGVRSVTRDPRLTHVNYDAIAYVALTQ